MTGQMAINFNIAGLIFLGIICIMLGFVLYFLNEISNRLQAANQKEAVGEQHSADAVRKDHHRGFDDPARGQSGIDRGGEQSRPGNSVSPRKDSPQRPQYRDSASPYRPAGLQSTVPPSEKLDGTRQSDEQSMPPPIKKPRKRVSALQAGKSADDVI